MFTKEYNPHLHSFVLINHPHEAWKGPLPITLFTGSHVWVPASFAHELGHDIILVGDGRSNGYDVEGNCIVSVPMALVDGFLTDEEAEQVANLIDADETLMGYAR